MLQIRFVILDRQFLSASVMFFLSLTSVLLDCNIGFSKTGEVVLIDETISKVDGKPVLYSSVVDKIRKGQVGVIGIYPATENLSDFDKALEDAINTVIVDQKLKDVGIEIGEDEIDQEIEKFTTGKKMTVEELKAQLEKQSVSYSQYREDFRQLLLGERFRGRFIDPLVKISDKELREYFSSQAGSSSSLIYSLRYIIVAKKDDQAKKRASEILVRITSKEKTFEEAVKLYSDDPSAAEGGGKMDGVSLKDLDPVVSEAVRPLEKGQITGVVEQAQFFAIFKVENTTLTDQSGFDKIKPKLEAEVKAKETARQIDLWLAETRAGFRIHKKPQPNLPTQLK